MINSSASRRSTEIQTLARDYERRLIMANPSLAAPRRPSGKLMHRRGGDWPLVSFSDISAILFLNNSGLSTPQQSRIPPCVSAIPAEDYQTMKRP
jgi:hypothetical protein